MEYSYKRQSNWIKWTKLNPILPIKEWQEN